MPVIIRNILNIPKALRAMHKTDQVIRDTINEKGLEYFIKNKQRLLRDAGL